jgi:hypothetical protein
VSRRTKAFHLLLSDDELERLHVLAERDGLTAAGWIRHTMRVEERRFDKGAEHLAPLMPWEDWQHGTTTTTAANTQAKSDAQKSTDAGEEESRPQARDGAQAFAQNQVERRRARARG